MKSERNISGKEQTFYWDSNVVSMKEEGEDIYYLQDDLGSPMHLLDEEGRSKASYGYGEYGEEKQFFGDAGFQPFGYTGYQKEEAGGLYYTQARRYDADTGRFISEDKIKGFITMPDCNPIMAENLSLSDNVNLNDLTDETSKYVGITENEETGTHLNGKFFGTYIKTVISGGSDGKLINVTTKNGIPVGYSLNHSLDYSLNGLDLKENRSFGVNSFSHACSGVICLCSIHFD